MTRQLTRKVSELKPHPDQGRVYGDTCDAKLVESIEKLGIQTPLLITRENVIVGGFRRWQAAMKAGLEAVPVIIFDSDDDLDIQEALVHNNIYREKKTRRQIACEAQFLLKVEQFRALRRQRDAGERGGKASGETRRGETKDSRPGRLTLEEAGKAVDKVGQAFDPPLSGDTVERAVEVAEAIQEMEQAGDVEGVQKLTETLETRGFKPAYQEATKKKKKPRKKRPPTLNQTFHELAVAWSAFLDAVRRLSEHSPEGEEVAREWCEGHRLDYNWVMDPQTFLAD